MGDAMMKVLVALILLAFSGSAFSQGSGSNTLNSILLGKGAGVTGFGEVARGTTGQFLSENNPGVPSWAAVTTGTVTSITPDGGLVSSDTISCSQTAITTTGTLSAARCVNAQTGASYAILNGDRAKLITASNAGAQAYTIAQAGTSSQFSNGWFTEIRNKSTNVAGIVTVTPTTSTIDGAATLKIQPGQSVRIVSDGTNYQTIGGGTVNQVPGTATNDAANAGNLGEYIESIVLSASPVAASTGTPSNVTSISLTAGDWDVTGAVLQNPAATTSFTANIASVSTTSATLDASYVVQDRFAAVVPVNPIGGHSIARRVSLSATTTVYLVQQATFTVSTTGGYGYIFARRVR